MKKLAIALAALVLTASACWPFDEDDPLGTMEVKALSGLVRVWRNNEPIPVKDRLQLRPRDVITTARNSAATFQLASGRKVRMDEKSQVRVRTATAIEGQGGRLLATISSGDTLKVSFDGVDAIASAGKFRVDRGFGSARAASYSARVRLEAPGQPRLTLSRLFEVTVAAGELPNAARPYRLNPKDPWDVALLSPWIDLQQQLELLARGFSNQTGRSRPGVDYFSSLVGGRNVSFMERFLDHKPADLLIGFTIAQNADDQRLKEAVQDAFGLFDRGASWGVTAAIMRVVASQLVADLEDVIVGTGIVAADGSAARPDFTVAAAEDGAATTGTVTTGDLSTGSTTTGGTATTGGTTQTGTTTGTGGGTTGDGGPEDCTDTVDCAAQDVQDRIPDPSPSPTNLLDDALD